MRTVFVCLCTILLLGCDDRVPRNPVTGPTPSAPPPAPGPIPPPPTYTVSGVVKTTANVPVAGARVVVLGQESPAVATTDADGRYSVSAVKASPAESMAPLLSASKAGFFTDVEFAGGSYSPISRDTQLDFELSPSASISLGDVIRGQSPDGDPVCSHWGYGSTACQRFALTVPASGNLEVTLSAPVFNFDVDIVGPDGTFALYSAVWVSPLRVSIPVVAGSTYEIRVIGGWSPPRQFQLTTTVR